VSCIILLVASKKDPASLNIAKEVLACYHFAKSSEIFQGNPLYEASASGREIKLVTLLEESVRAQRSLEAFDGVELVTFISRHSSESGTPTLSVHVPGNLGEAELGGLPRKVSVAAANAMRDALKALARLKEEMRLNYEVSYECTHHGPSLDIPTMFVELGSSPAQWSDVKAAEAVARAAIESVSNFRKSESKAVLGIGGTHYNAKFTRMALQSEIAFGHMIPKYAVGSIDEEILKQCADRTYERVAHAVMDWKGIRGEDKPHVIATLGKIGLPFEKA
jgi:D-aminoacyl-tRNA deacylase